MPLSNLAEAELRRQAVSWLAGRLEDRKLRVGSAYLFGSVLHDHYPTSDVDLAIQFEPLNERNLGRAAKRFKRQLSQDFGGTFGHPLHVTFFTADEQERRDAFLLKAGKHERLR